eukprot:gene10249-11303_t
MVDVQIVYSLFLVFAQCFSFIHTSGLYKWDISIVKYETNFGYGLLNETDYFCPNAIDCGNIYAQIKVVRTEDAGKVLDISSVMNPNIQVVIKTEEKEHVHMVDPLIVKSDTCHCLFNQSFNWLAVDRQNLHPKNSCIPQSLVCEKMYLIPVPYLENSTSAQVIVQASKIGPFIERKSVTFFNASPASNGYNIFEILPNNNLSVTTALNTINAYVNTVPEYTKLWILPINNYILMTSNEFETFKAGILSSQIAMKFSTICNDWQSEVKDILNLPDRVLVASKYGLLEQINPNTTQPSIPVRVLNSCIRSLKSVAQPALTNYTIVALDDIRNTSYYATITKGASLEFQPLNEPVCHAIQIGTSSSCDIISVALSRNSPDKIFYLFHNGSYLLVEISVSDGQFEIFPAISEAIINNNISSSGVAYNLSELFYTPQFANHLFMLGNVLLYSSNAGRAIFKIIFLEDDAIEILACSRQGDYAFLTSKRKIFVGKVGSLDLRSLDFTKPAQNQITLFYDSDNVLFQLLATRNNENTSHNIMKYPIPSRQVVKMQNVALDVLNSWQSCTVPDAGSVACNTTAVQMSTLGTKHERLCPFSRTSLRSFSYQFYSRRPITVYCLNDGDSDLITKRADIQSRGYEAKHIKSNSSYLDNCLWESPLHVGNRLPMSISLGRSSCYYFEIDIYLNSMENSDFYAHEFTLNDLSLSVSSPEYLKVYQVKSIDFVEDRLQYKIELCDAGMKRYQQPPGVQQDIVTAIIKIPGAGLHCITNSYQDVNDVQGYFTTEVKLGCPGLQKVVFDAKASEIAGGKQYCKQDDPSVPCFHFERVYNPIFRLFDEATLTNDEFAGNYTLTVVGGGLTLDTISQFTEEEQENYNYKARSYLIWAPVDSHQGKPVFNNASRSLRWLCSNKSPCAGISPDFPDSAVYFLNIEFSNR